MLQVFKKKKITLCDCTHVIGIGFKSNISSETIKKYYSSITFNFAYLEQAHDFFKGLIGKDFDPYDIKCYVPNRNGPIIFTYSMSRIFSTKRKELFFAIAHMIEENKNEIQ